VRNVYINTTTNEFFKKSEILADAKKLIKTLKEELENSN
jgi:hypothetical protein